MAQQGNSTKHQLTRLTDECSEALEGFVIDSLRKDLEQATDQQDQAARSETLEQLALYHAQCDDAAKACYYLCRSLGLARQQEPGEPTLELLFELLGALADLPADLGASAQAEPVGEADGLGVFELCHQLAAARELTQAAWDQAEQSELTDAPCPSAPAHALH
ncbi:hypothetical protein [Paucibacter soli]|uniref:hypothetical protein n=1 Tax=Paucibacter soli TaxID=3133433 RepID=UPI0030A31CC8